MRAKVRHIFLCRLFLRDRRALRAFPAETAQIVQKSGRAPEKHACVPEILPGCQIFPRNLDFGLFGESANHIGRCAVRPCSGAAAFDVSVAGFGARRGDAEDNHVAGLLRLSRCAARDKLAITGSASAICSCPKEARPSARHRACVRGAPPQDRSPRRYCGPRAPPEFATPALRGISRRTAAACSAFVTAQTFFAGTSGARRATVSRSIVSRASNIEDLFRRAHAAARPEARSTSSGQQHGAGRKRLFHAGACQFATLNVSASRSLAFVRRAPRIAGQNPSWSRAHRFSREVCARRIQFVIAERRRNHPHLCRTDSRSCSVAPDEFGHCPRE